MVQVGLPAFSSEETPKKRTIKPPTRDLPDESAAQNARAKFKGPMPEGLRHCNLILRELLSPKHSGYAWPFYHPVDVKALNLHDYYDIIKQPMDLGTIKNKMEERQYKNAHEFAADVRIMFTNCYRYNSPEHDVVKMAKQLQVGSALRIWSAHCKDATKYVFAGA